MWNLHGDIMLIPLSNTIWHCVTQDNKHTCSFPLPQYVEQTLTLMLPAALLCEKLTIFSDGCLGLNTDEGRSEVR